MYERKILLGFIRVHILHHATEDEGVYGTWMMEELRRHGYNISCGTLYPILHEMHKSGMLSMKKVKVNGRIRKVYRTTAQGKKTFEYLKGFVKELSREVV
jgi:DNA-binding PadR family transcriptional regulator